MGIETIVLAAVAAVGTAASYSAQKKQAKEAKKAAKAQEKARKAQQVRDDLSARRTRRKQIMEAQRKRAQIIAQGEAAGVSGSSGVVGGAGSINTQLAANTGFLNTNVATSNFVSGQNQIAADAQSKGAYYGAQSNLFSGVAQQAGGFESIGKLFS